MIAIITTGDKGHEKKNKRRKDTALWFELTV